MRGDIRSFMAGIVVGAVVRTVLGDENIKKIRTMISERAHKFFEEYKNRNIFKEGADKVKSLVQGQMG